MTDDFLVIDGSLRSKASSTNRTIRYLAILNGDNYYLQGKSFFYLAKLAYWRRIGDGWVYVEDIEPGYNQIRSIYMLRNSIPVKIENNQRSCYRLMVKPRRISFNHAVLSEFPDIDIRGLFRG